MDDTHTNQHLTHTHSTLVSSSSPSTPCCLPTSTSCAATPLTPTHDNTRSHHTPPPPTLSSSSPHSASSAPDSTSDATTTASSTAISPSLSQRWSLPFEIGNPDVQLLAGTLWLSRAPPPYTPDNKEVRKIVTMEEHEEKYEEIKEEKHEHVSYSTTSQSLASQQHHHAENDEFKQHTDHNNNNNNPITSASSSSSSLHSPSLSPHVSPSLDETNEIPSSIELHCACACVLDIPSYISFPELHDFIQPFTCVNIQLIRIPTRAHKNECYAAMLQFEHSSDCLEFIHEYDGRVYNALENDVCVVRALLHVQFNNNSAIFPIHMHREQHSINNNNNITNATTNNNNDKSRPSTPEYKSLSSISTASSTSSSNLITTCSSTTCSSSPCTVDMSNCPVCLEAIVPPSPMLTLLCCHVFHVACLAQWVDNTCPVCRYMVQPNVHTECWMCAAQEKLWMCIICGHVGCSRYSGGHAVKHFQQTQHNYALEVATQRVWDYVSDCYVHRLVRNKTDGKLVEYATSRVPDTDIVQPPATCDTSEFDAVNRSPEVQRTQHFVSTFSIPQPAAYASVKLEEYLMEYNYLLSSQLDQQRRIFTVTIRQIEAENKRKMEECESQLETQRERERQLEQRQAAAHEAHAAATATLSSLQSEYQSLITQAVQLKVENRRLLDRERKRHEDHINERKQREIEEDKILRSKDEEIRNLEDQLHDLQFFLDTQSKIGKNANLKEQLMAGEAKLQLIEVGEEEDSNSKLKKKKRNK